ncbi:MAG: hypothetical protein HY700_15375 [Gemmatimonadetes bacterium]|nr:hypothetical protein [Gemmatimonadota bacterium]
MRLDKLAQLRSSGRNPRWFVVSLAIHVVLVGGLILLFHPLPTRTVRYIDLGAPAEPMPAYQPQRGAGRATRTPSPRPTRAPPMPTAPTMAAGIPIERDTARAITEVSDQEDTLPIGTHRELGPQYGDGRLWVRPSDAAAGRVPARNAIDTVPVHIAKIDSALAEKIRSYLDTVPPDSFAIRAAPKWTTEIAGKTWGIDGKWIYLGGIKIPTAVLALLPLPPEAAGNYDAAQRAARLDAMRRDIMEAALRASNAVEFKRYVKEVRERKEMERRAREAPNPPAPPRPAPPDSVKRPEPLIP